MRAGIGKRLILQLSAAAALAVLPQLAAVGQLPGEMSMYAGSVASLPAASMARVSLDDGTVAEIRPRSGNDDAIELSAKDAGSAELTYSLLGLVPVKRVSLSVVPERRLMPGGESVGIAIDTAGVIVIGASDLGNTPSPARLAGIKNGDIIRRVNGAAVDSAAGLSEAITSGETARLDIIRDGSAMTCEVSPALDERDGAWRLGAWVRDSTAGVGTLTFVDPETGLYGALGHAITDSDTNVMMPVGMGELYGNNIVDITPSQSGAPGELTGDFVFSPNAIGTVEANTNHGIFGRLDSAIENALYPDGLPVGGRQALHTGAASVLTSLDGNGVREYACEIVRLNDRDGDGTRAMVVRMTDPELLERTGGIVQGMSGSPIIQDGRLVGAVTHVMVNDPTMGYGIGIEAMMESAKETGVVALDELPSAA